MLDVLDKELEKRGHRFVRYADDCNIYVRSRRAGERVMASVTHFLARRAEADGKRRQERGGPPSGAGLPGLQLHERADTQAAHRAAGTCPAQGAGPGDDAPHEERQPWLSRCGVVPLPCRVAGLLRLLRDPLGVAPPRSMGQAAAPRHRLAAMEAWAYPLCGAASPRGQQAPGGENRRQCPWPMAAQQQPRALLRPAKRFLHSAWSRLPREPCRSLNPSNRRVRTRMHGNGIRINIFAIRISRPLRFGRVPEAGACRWGWFRCQAAARLSHLLLDCLDVRW